MSCFRFLAFFNVLQIQRALRSSDAEKVEAQDRVSELTTSTSSLQSAKRKADQELVTLKDELEDLESESTQNAEKLRKALEQNGRLQSENVSAKDRLASVEKAKVSVLI